MGLNLLMTVILTASLVVVVVVTSSSSLVEDGDVEPASGTSERSGLLGTARPNGVLDATKERLHPPWQDDFFGLIRSRNRRNPPNGPYGQPPYGQPPYGQPPYGWRPGGYFGFPGQMPFCPRTTAAAATTAAATTAAATTAAATTAAATTAAATTAATTRPATTAAATAAATTTAAATKHPNPLGYYYYY